MGIAGQLLGQTIATARTTHLVAQMTNTSSVTKCRCGCGGCGWRCGRTLVLAERGVMATMLGGGHYRLHPLSWRFGAHAHKYMIHLHVPPTAGLRYLFTILSALFWYIVDSPDDPFQVQCTGTVA